LSSSNSPKIVHIAADDDVSDSDDENNKVLKKEKTSDLDESAKEEVVKDAKKTLAKKDKKLKN